MDNTIHQIITQALASLTTRQRDIIQLRYGLKSGDPQTLAAIGDRYKVTRERIRQIEAHALRTLKTEFVKAEFNSFRANIEAYLQKNNGVRRHSLVATDFHETENTVRCALEISGAARFHLEDKNNYAFWSLSDEGIKRSTAFVNSLAGALKAKPQTADILSREPMAHNYISISKKFAISPHGEFGLAEWRHINPKVSRDWAYLVLKKANKPLHFSEITMAINKLRAKKKVNPQTIHNELIKDKRFILVGRGMYGLSQFNILAGTAREVLTHLLKKHGPLPAKDIIKITLAHRPFKEKTLLINLQNKNWFKRLDEGKYFVRKV